MEQILAVLCSLLFVLATVAVLGHGLWVLGTQVLEFLFSGKVSERSGARALRWRCLKCGSRLPPGWEKCNVCGADNTEAFVELEDLDAVERQLERFGQRGVLPQETLNRLTDLIRASRARLLQGNSPPAHAEGVPVEGVPELRPRPKKLRWEGSPAEPPVSLAPVASGSPVPQSQVGEIPPKPVLEAAPLPADRDIPSEQARPASAPAPVVTPPAPAPVFLPPPVPPPTKPPRRHRNWTELLAAFMEEKNILWGELLGGLLIVGGSIALVISLWHTLEENPYFPFGIFGAVTAGLFGAGLYTLHHWKLESTSRGLLVIASLLTPLNFLVMPGMLQDGGGAPLEGVIAVVGLAAFAFFVYQAARVLTLEAAWQLPLVVLGCSAAQLIIGHRLVGEQPPALNILWLGLLPAVCHGVGLILPLRRLEQSDSFGRDRVWSLLFLLGIGTFSLGVAYGFLALRCDQLGVALQGLSALQALSAVPVLLGGLLLQRRLENQPGLAGMWAVGTALALSGVAVMLLALALAWPDRVALLAVCLIDAGVLTWLAFRRGLPWLHPPALACLIFAWLLVPQLQTAGAEELSPLTILGEVPTALRLLSLALVLVGLGEGLARWQYRADAIRYAVTGGVLAGLSLLLAGWHGLAQPENATLIYGVLGAAVIGFNQRWRVIWLNHAGLTLLILASLWGLHWQAWGDYPIWSVVLALEGLILVVLTFPLSRKALPLRGGRQPHELSESPKPSALAPALTQIALVTAAVAAVLGILSGFITPWHGAHVIAGLALVLLHFLLTWRHQDEQLARVTGYLIVGTAVALSGWLAVTLQARDLQAVLALGLSLTSVGLAAVRLLPASPGGHSLSLLTAAWREPLELAGLLTLPLCVTSSTLFEGHFAPATLLGLTVAAWLTAWLHRQPGWTCVGALLLLPALGLQLLPHDFLLAQLGLLTLLLHASSLALAGWALRLCKSDISPTLERVLARPFRQMAILTSLLAVPLLLLERSQMGVSAAFAAWLTGLWLILSWLLSSVALFAGCQLASVLAVIYGTTAWLQGQEWVILAPENGLWDPRSLQSYGLALTGLTLVWMLARFGLQNTRAGRELRLSGGLSVDRLLLWGLILAQMGLVDWAALRGVLAEMMPAGQVVLSDWWPEIYVHAWGEGAWWLLGGLGLVTAVAWRQSSRTRQDTLLQLELLGLTIPVLCAATWESWLATASALRWELALAYLIGAAIACGLRENPSFRRILFDAAALPVLLLTVALFILRSLGAGSAGPASGTVFAALGLPLSATLPLLLLVGGMVTLALRHRLLVYAWAAGWLVTIFAVGLYTLVTLPEHPWFGPQQWMALLQVGAITIVGWGLFCLRGCPWASRWASERGSAAGFCITRPTSARREDERWEKVLTGQVLLGLLLACFPLLLVLTHLVAEPWNPGFIVALGVDGIFGWVAVGLTVAALLLYLRLPFQAGLIHGVGLAVILVGLQTLCAVARWDTGWLTYHLLLVLPLLTGVVLLAAHLPHNQSLQGEASSQRQASPQRQLGEKSIIRLWLEAMISSTTLLALLWCSADPSRPWWPAGGLLAALLLTLVLTCWSRHQRYITMAGVLLALAGLTIWLAWGEGRQELLTLTLTLCLAAGSVGTAALETWLASPAASAPESKPSPPRWSYSRLAGLAALGLLLIEAVIGIRQGIGGRLLPLPPFLLWSSWVVTAWTLWLCWVRDRTAPGSARTLPLFLAGLLGLVFALQPLWTRPRDLLLWGQLVLALYLLATAGLYHCGVGLARWGFPNSIRQPQSAIRKGEPWFVPSQALLGVLVMITAVWIVLAFPTVGQRLVGPLGVLLLVPAGVLLVGVQGSRPATQTLVSLTELRHGTLAVGTLAATLLAWSWLKPDHPRLHLSASVLLLVVLAVMALFQGVGMRYILPMGSAWVACAGRQGRVLGILGALVVLVVLGQEAALFDFTLRRAPVDTWEILVVMMALLLLAAAGICFAVLPWSDPFSLSEYRRPAYVYAAEVCLLLMYVHARLTIPEFIIHSFRVYWPLVIIGIAFLGIGLGELFTRWKMPVLAEPLQRTALFLPLLPLLVFWLPGSLHPSPFLAGEAAFSRYALVWFLVSGLYLTAALSRRSQIWAVVAALAGNFGLWSLLYQHQDLGVGFLAHPQLWLIPLALIILVTEHLHRSRLPAATAVTLRYLGILMLYLSSTADLFLAEPGDIPMSLVLAVLSIAGVLLGILLRVRAFLFSGLTFLGLVIFARIWHAAVDQAHVWVWWVSVIVLGVLVLTMVALFEKRRAEVLQLLEDLKRWD